MKLAPYSLAILAKRERDVVPNYLRVFVGWDLAPTPFPKDCGIVIPLGSNLEALDLRVAAGLDCVLLFRLENEVFARSVVDLLRTRWRAVRVLGLPQPFVVAALITSAA